MGSSAPSRRLFGTDGVRGPANCPPLTPELALRLGMAAGRHFLRAHKDPSRQVVIGKDTRISCDLFEAALVAGLTSAGYDAVLAGIIPTPAVAFLTRELGADAGIVISASHNSFEDNGIKFFGRDGFKLPDETEAAIEDLVFGEELDGDRAFGADVGRVRQLADASDRYVDYLGGFFPKFHRRLHVVLDCAHGAAFEVAPRAFADAGLQVTAVGVTPDGLNINRDVGALHVDALQKRVVAEGADLGVALDGDADRLILVDESGAIVDGDRVMAILAADMKAQGTLAGDTVVATVMSNFGLEVALREQGVSLHRTQVGDRYVVQEMRDGGFSLGGEQSGHLVRLPESTTGDGTVAAAAVLAALERAGGTLSELHRGFQDFPQILINLKVTGRPQFHDVPSIHEAITTAEARLGESGRVVVRYSGTEFLARVMAQGEDGPLVESCAADIAQAIRAEIGAENEAP